MVITHAHFCLKYYCRVLPDTAILYHTKTILVKPTKWYKTKNPHKGALGKGGVQSPPIWLDPPTVLPCLPNALIVSSISQ